MHFNFRQPLGFASVAVLAVAFTVPQPTFAQSHSQLASQSTNHAATDHLVAPGDLQQAVQDATQTRQQNMDTLRSFLSSPKAQKALEQAHINPEQVQNAVAGLNDQELAQLSARATKAQNDFAAGTMSNNDLLLILVVLAVIILIIVAVR